MKSTSQPKPARAAGAAAHRKPGSGFTRILGLVLKRPFSFSIAVLLILAAGVVGSCWNYVSFRVTSKVVRNVHATHAATVCADWQEQLRLETDAVRKEILSSENIRESAVAAGLLRGKASRLFGQANPGVDELVERIRHNAQLKVSSLDEYLDVIEIELRDTRPSQLSALAPALAMNYTKQFHAAQQKQAEQAYELAEQESDGAHNRVETLTTLRKLAIVEDEISEFDAQLQSLSKLHEELLAPLEKAQELANNSPGTKVQKKWQTIEEMEKELARMNLSSEERKRMIRYIEQFRRQAASSPAEPEATPDPPSELLPAPDTAKLAEVESQLRACQENLRERRAEKAKLLAGLTELANLQVSPEDLDRNLFEARQAALDLDAKASRLKIALGVITNRQAVEFSVENSRVVPEAPWQKLGLCVGATVLLSLIIGLVVVRLIEGPDTTFRTVADVQKHLQIPVLGAVRIVPARSAAV